MRHVFGNIWNAFNAWRREGWLFRVIILLLIFSPAFYERLTGYNISAQQCKATIDAYLLQSESELAVAKANYYNIRDAQALRSAIRSQFEMDSPDGGSYDPLFLRLEGITPAELSKRAVKQNASAADLERLSSFAKRYGIVPSSYSVREMRSEALHSSLAEVESENKSAKTEINDFIVPQQPKRDLLRVSFWKKGFVFFINSLLTFCLACFTPLSVTIPWFVICFFVAAILGKAKGRGWALTIPLVFTAVLAIRNLHLLVSDYCPDGDWLWDNDTIQMELFYAVALLFLVAAICLKGVQTGFLLSRRALLGSFLLAGMLWVALQLLIPETLNSGYFALWGMGDLLAMNAFCLYIQKDTFYPASIAFALLALGVIGVLCMLLRKKKTAEEKR